MLEPVYRTLIA